MRVIKTAAEMQASVHPNRATVFTMGALHEGHKALMTAARKIVGASGEVVVSIFVNPTQFNDPADFEKYPNTLDADLAVCEAAGVDIVFVPTVSEMYPTSLPQYSAGELGAVLEGASRPGHFDAVATVVARLLDLTKPAHTCFGEKDYQQLTVVKKLVSELGGKTEVHGIQTVRDQNGLALSSRNSRLSEAGLRNAAVLSQALCKVGDEILRGSSLDAARRIGIEMIQAQPEITLDYLEVRTDALERASETTTPIRVLVAAMVEGVRLIDNLEVVRA